MTSSISDTRKKGRPKVGAVQVQVRIPPELLASLDTYIGDWRPGTSRPEAIRLILIMYLADHEDRVEEAREEREARGSL